MRKLLALLLMLCLFGCGTDGPNMEFRDSNNDKLVGYWTSVDSDIVIDCREYAGMKIIDGEKVLFDGSVRILDDNRIGCFKDSVLEPLDLFDDFYLSDDVLVVLNGGDRYEFRKLTI